MRTVCCGTRPKRNRLNGSRLTPEQRLRLILLRRKKLSPVSLNPKNDFDWLIIQLLATQNEGGGGGT